LNHRSPPGQGILNNHTLDCESTLEATKETTPLETTK
jgi:hypothetical protein